MTRRSFPVLFAVLLGVLLLVPPFPKAAAADASVTIGYLPLAARSETVMIRGTAPAGSAVDISVNGTPVVRVYASQAMAVYAAPVPLQPGFNQITARLVGTEAVASASIYRVTASFTDLEADPLRDDIEVLATLGILSGDGTGLFLPEGRLTRAELATMLTLALGLPEGDPAVLSNFADADAVPAWARPYVAAICQAGLMQGYPDGTFQPSRTLTRAELIATVVRAVPAEAGGTGTAAGIAAAYPDVIPAWVEPYAERAAQLELIGPFWGEQFQASDPATRRMAAAVIRRLVDLLRAPAAG